MVYSKLSKGNNPGIVNYDAMDYRVLFPDVVQLVYFYEAIVLYQSIDFAIVQMNGVDIPLLE